MHKELIIAAFEKARKELQSEGIKDPSNHQVAICISDFMKDEVDFPISKKSISSYYKSAMEIPESEDINISQIKVVQGLCTYVGYTNYNQFILNLESSETNIKDDKLNKKTDISTHGISRKSKRNIAILISMGIILIVVTIIIISINKQHWMIWNEDHYEEVDFNKEGIANGTLKLLKEERIENFRKVNAPDCNYRYFKEDGSVNTWYGKNKNGEIEIFTALGLHPETGKTLKPITKYMIRKYLCDSY